MAALLLLVACLAAGVVLRMTGRLGDGAAASFNAYVINVALPALALYHVHRAPLDISFVQAALTSWLMLGAAGVFFALIARRAGLDLIPAVIRQTDDLGSIYDKYRDVAMLSKYSGGIGIAFTRVRSRGSLIRGTNILHDTPVSLR